MFSSVNGVIKEARAAAENRTPEKDEHLEHRLWIERQRRQKAEKDARTYKKRCDALLRSQYETKKRCQKDNNRLSRAIAVRDRVDFFERQNKNNQVLTFQNSNILTLIQDWADRSSSNTRYNMFEPSQASSATYSGVDPF